MHKNKIVHITLWANRITAVIVVALIFTLPALLNWYADQLHYAPPQRDVMAVSIAFDLCAVAMLMALWHMEKLLQNIRAQKVFVKENVRRVRRIVWCCGIISLICLVATRFMLPMLIFAAIMAFLGLAISVVGCVLDAAVAIREENDLTI